MRKRHIVVLSEQERARLYPPDGAAGLQANRFKPWLTQRWCIPPEQDGEFCWRIEDVLAV